MWSSYKSIRVKHMSEARRPLAGKTEAETEDDDKDEDNDDDDE